MATALIPLIPTIVAGAPGVISAIGNIINTLVHKHQKATVSADPGAAPTPASGAVKKQAAMNDFALIAGPLIEAIYQTNTGKTLDVNALEASVSGLIDNFVALNKALGVFPATPPKT